MRVGAAEGCCCLSATGQVPKCGGWCQLQSDSHDHSALSPLVHGPSAFWLLSGVTDLAF